MKKRNLLYILPLIFAVGCEPEFDDVNLSRNNGSADFTRTVSIGNSLTAGYQSNALSRDGQENSIPEILAKQFALAGGGEFKSPYLTGEAGERGAGISAISLGVLTPSLALLSGTDCNGVSSIGPKLNGSPYPTGDNFASIASQGPFNNVGVPGARLIHINFPGYGSSQGNPYFERFAASPTETMVEHAMSINPTFFTLWIGNNDVLGYATSGGEEGGDTITDAGKFAALYNQTISTLVADSAKGAIANIPDITSIPFFNTVPANAIPVSGTNVALLNAAYANYNALVEGYRVATVISDEEAALRTISFADGANYMITSDPNLTALTNPTNGQPVPKIRQLKAGELVTLTLPQDSLKCAGWGTQVPVPGQYILLSQEIDKISNAVTSYNAVIESAAQINNLALVDANKRMKELQTGINFNGTTYTARFVTGGAFSLDGVHPNSRGYAIIANLFIDAINATYGSNVSQVNANAYPTIE